MTMTNEQLGQLAREVLASAELSKTSGVDGVITVNADLLFRYLTEQGRARREAKYAAERG
jgi:hypothetical protein